MRAMQLDTPIGPITLAEDDGHIVGLRFGENPGPDDASSLLRMARAQLLAYFGGVLRQFDLPLRPSGTAFQRRVWACLSDIPYGETRSYRQIAEAVGAARGYRAVGMANNKNPIAILIPCHRVIGADGRLTGYGGGMAVKAFLLRLEGARLSCTAQA